MTFPALHTVKWYVYDDSAEDELGNDIPAWLPAEERKIIGWKPTVTENMSGQFEAREITDAELQVPPGFTYNIQDRMQLPGSTDLYEVVAVRTGGLAFTGWNPGDVLSMRLVKN